MAAVANEAIEEVTISGWYSRSVSNYGLHRPEARVVTALQQPQVLGW